MTRLAQTANETTRHDMHHGPETTPTPCVLPLQHGVRLSRSEFERRYMMMTHVRKAELIDGVVHIPPAVRFRGYARARNLVSSWLMAYWVATPGVHMVNDVLVRLDEYNEVMPDVALRLDPMLGGASRLADEDYIEGPPELIVEIAADSNAYNLYDKLRTYRRAGVREYLVWLVHEQRLDWWVLQQDTYTVLEPDEQGIMSSIAFPGLSLDRTALFAEDSDRLLDTLQERGWASMAGLRNLPMLQCYVDLAGQGE